MSKQSKLIQCSPTEYRAEIPECNSNYVHRKTALELTGMQMHIYSNLSKSLDEKARLSVVEFMLSTPNTTINLLPQSIVAP